jgi:hypothetical protein
MEEDNDADEDLREEGAAEGEAPPGHTATRGLGWVVAAAAAGVVAGAILGPLAASVPILPALWGPTPSLVRGALVGGIAGAAVGVFIWAFFPYRGDRGPDEPPQS